MDESASRFWEKYISKTATYNVPNGARRWYVKHVEAFIKAHPSRRLVDVKADDVASYLKKLGRNPQIPDWRFRQVAEALHILYVEIIKPDWAVTFNWDTWSNDSRTLEPDHATLARIPDERQTPPRHAFQSAGSRAGGHFEQQFPELLERLVAEIRIRGYSIRTEQTYVSWAARFLLFSSFQSQDEILPEKIAPYLEYLAIKRNVSVSTQKLALNALVFMFRHVLNIPVEDHIDFARAKKPRRLPVVLSRNEINRLLSGIKNELHYMMACLLYGAGLRLIECVRLRVCDIDFEYRQIIVRNGKGNKDRVVPLPEKLLQPMQQQIDKVRMLQIGRAHV